MTSTRKLCLVLLLGATLVVPSCERKKAPPAKDPGKTTQPKDPKVKPPGPPSDPGGMTPRPTPPKPPAGKVLAAQDVAALRCLRNLPREKLQVVRSQKQLDALVKKHGPLCKGVKLPKIDFKKQLVLGRVRLNMNAEICNKILVPFPGCGLFEPCHVGHPFFHLFVIERFFVIIYARGIDDLDKLEPL